MCTLPYFLLRYFKFVICVHLLSRRLLRSWLYSCMWAFASLMDLIQYYVFFNLCSQFLILHFLI
jgi:hypothetical protein